MEGIEGVDKQAIGAVMNEDEKRVLAVYDRLEQLQFEIELLKSRGILSQGDCSCLLILDWADDYRSKCKRGVAERHRNRTARTPGSQSDLPSAKQCCRKCARLAPNIERCSRRC